MRELLDDIVAGAVAPGEMLPREVDLVERFQVSRGVVRECLRGLEERGVVRVKHGRGATVTEPQEWEVFDPDVLEAMLRSPHGDALEEEAIECQRLLEIEAAGLAAERARDEDLAALTAAIDRLAEADDHAARVPAAVDRFHDADLDFHRAIVRASGNRAIGRLSAPLHRALAVAARRRADVPGPDDAVGAHRRILSAVAAGNADAAREAMGAHLADRGRRPAR
jgi:GntR family transcriptional regulator, galactonate operon transcriptional repressor